MTETPPQGPGWPGQPQYPGYGGGYPGQGYGAPGYYAPQTETKAIVALVLSIVSFLVCPVLPAIVALVFASQAKAAIDASGGRLTGEGMVTAAKVVAWINIALGVVAIAFTVIIVAAAHPGTTGY